MMNKIKFSLLTIIFLSLSCSDNAEFNDELDTQSTIEEQDYSTFRGISVEPVTLESAKNSFDNINNKATSKEPNPMGVSISTDSAKYLDLLDLESDVVVAEATTKYPELLSNVSQIQINGEIQTVLSHFDAKGFDGPNQEYNGVQWYTNLDGVLLDAYYFQNGIAEAQLDINEVFLDLTYKAQSHGESNKSFSIFPFIYSPCYGIACGINLEGVTVTGYTPASTSLISINRPVGQWTVGLNPNNRWTGYSDGIMNYAFMLRKRAKSDKIRNSLKNKESCVHDLINNFDPYQTRTIIMDLMEKFNGNDDGFNVSIITSDSRLYVQGGEAAATTQGFPSGSLITINGPWANSAISIEIARTILHEYLHADMFAKLNTNAPSDGSNFNDTYSTIHMLFQRARNTIQWQTYIFQLWPLP